MYSNVFELFVWEEGKRVKMTLGIDTTNSSIITSTALFDDSL